MTSPPTAETIERRGHGGVRLAGDLWSGEPGALGVVLLHGGGQTRHSWNSTAVRLARAGYTVLAMDARGHGESGWDPAGDYSLATFAADLEVIVAGFDQPPVLIGASMGGMASLLAAGEHPEITSALVLVDVVVAVEPVGVARIFDFMNGHRDGFATLDEVADAVAAYNPLRRRPRNLDGLRKNVRLREDGRWYWHWDPAFIRVGDEPQRSFDPRRLRAAAGTIRVPTLLVHGLQSEVVSDSGIADMLTLVPHARTIEVPQAGHMVAGDDNDVFVERLTEFLDEVGVQLAAASTLRRTST